MLSYFSPWGNILTFFEFTKVDCSGNLYIGSNVFLTSVSLEISEMIDEIISRKFESETGQ